MVRDNIPDIHGADNKFELRVQRSFIEFTYIYLYISLKKDVYGERSRWEGREAPYETDREDRRKHML